MRNLTRPLVFIATTVALAFCFIAVGGARERSAESSAEEVLHTAKKYPARIVSVAPSITEILFAVGAGDRVFGATDFCDYPEEAKSIPRIGGFFDPNYEAVLAIKPDVVFLLKTQSDMIDKLKALGIEGVVVENESLFDIITSIRKIGKRVGARERANSLASEMEVKIAKIKRNSVGKIRPSVMVSVFRDYGSGDVAEARIAGPGSIYDDLITLAGGRNVYEGPKVKYPVISGEAVLRLAPDFIIEIAPQREGEVLDVTVLIDDWKRVIKSGRTKKENIHAITDNFSVRPGPRTILLLERFSKIIQP